MLDFYNIRQIACQHFYKWEEGEDFVCLKNELHNFKPNLISDNSEISTSNFTQSLATIQKSALRIHF